MTAEVVVMNKVAAALAADSAITLGTSRKVYNTHEKLFMLVPGHPVGMMIFNDAEFMGLPWEAIIKGYRDRFLKKPRRFSALQQYAEDFIQFLESNGHELISDQQQLLVFRRTIESVLRQVLRDIYQGVKKKIDDTGSPISEDEIYEIVDGSIARFHADFSAYENMYSVKETKSFIDSLLAKYRVTIEETRDLTFHQLELSDENKRKIQELCLFLFWKDYFPSDFTGIVIAGFGRDALFPACVWYTIENLVCHKLKSKQRDETKIDFNNPIATIEPFAQYDVVQNFVMGVHPAYLDQLKAKLSVVLDEASINDVIDKVNSAVQEKHTNSILQAVAALPKDDLATMAETLVSITSFMRRVSLEVESVGGPIDVAVISKKDGFVWIKRKHYFDIRDNPHFANRYTTTEET